MEKRSKRNLKAPLSVGLFVTNRCDMNCKHCCTYGKLKDKELSFEEIIGIIDQLKLLQVFSVSVSGGEPLIRDDIFEILKKLQEARFKLRLCTNCTHVDEKTTLKLKEISPLDIRTSIDGSRALIHDRLRGKGSFEKTIRGIRLLIKGGFKVEARCTINRFNSSDLANIAQFSRDLGLKKLEFYILRNAGRANDLSGEISIRKDDFANANRVAEELIARFGSFAGGPFIEFFKSREKWKASGKKESEKAGRLKVCAAGTQTLSIRPDGLVIPCGAFWDYKAGSIRETSLNQIWNNSEVFKRMRTIDDISLDSIKECSRCGYKHYCHGGCRASAYYHSGSIEGFCGDCLIYG